jgi:hypothetical protein
MRTHPFPEVGQQTLEPKAMDFHDCSPRFSPNDRVCRQGHCKRSRLPSRSKFSQPDKTFVLGDISGCDGSLNCLSEIVDLVGRIEIRDQRNTRVNRDVREADFHKVSAEFSTNPTIGKRIAPCVLQYSSNEFGLRSYGERSPVVVVRYENALRFKNSYEFRDGYLGLGNMLQDAVNSAATF